MNRIVRRAASLAAAAGLLLALDAYTGTSQTSKIKRLLDKRRVPPAN